MLELILNNVLNEMTMIPGHQQFPKSSALRVRLSKDAAEYFLSSIFTDPVKTQLTDRIDDAYNKFNLSSGDQKQDNDQQAKKEEFIKSVSKTCLKVIGPIMDDYNTAIKGFNNNSVIEINLKRLKDQNPNRKWLYICDRKSLLVFIVIITLIILICVFVFNDTALSAGLGLALSLVFSLLFFLKGNKEKENRWEAALLKGDVYLNMKAKTFGQGFSDIDQKLNEVVPINFADETIKPTIKQNILECANIPGLANFFLTSNLWDDLPEDVLVLLAKHIYPPELFEYFIYWFNAQKTRNKIMPYYLDDQMDKDDKQEELQVATTSGHTTDASGVEMTTAGRILDITEADDDEKVIINIDVTPENQ